MAVIYYLSRADWTSTCSTLAALLWGLFTGIEPYIPMNANIQNSIIRHFLRGRRPIQIHTSHPLSHSHW